MYDSKTSCVQHLQWRGYGGARGFPPQIGALAPQIPAHAPGRLGL